MKLKLLSASVMSIIAAYVFYFFEWLFLSTKPSMFSAMSTWDSFRVLLVSPIPLITVSLVLILLIGLLGKLPVKIFSSAILGSLELLISALIVSTTGFLLIENFTYTLFDFNVGSFDGPVRYIYALLFLVLLGLTFRYLKSTSLQTSGLMRQKAIVFPVCVTLSMSVLFAAFQFEGTQPETLEIQNTVGVKLPNILILSTDGLIANRMSAYGYHRDTTPFISSLLEDALVLENSFTNAEKTAGSIVSLLSGKLPTTTRVLVRPDSLQGRNSYIHLPGLLKNLGYHTADISIRYYADTYDMNMKNAFDYANGRRISQQVFYSHLPLSVQLSYASELQFIEETSERVRERFLHALGLAGMVNPYDEVQQMNGVKKGLSGKDVDRIKNLFGFMDESEKPFFTHIHLLGTHGPTFSPRKRVFSVSHQRQPSSFRSQTNLPMIEQHQQRMLDWMGDFYDDAILDFDQHVREIFQHLENAGKLENTLIVLTSDHGTVRSSHERLPLIIWFPKHRHTGKISLNSQRIDIAPTILDFLDVPVPEWMEGDSLLEETNDPLRSIFSVGSNLKNEALIDGWWVITKARGPFDSLASLSMVHCHIWYFMSLENGLMTSQEVEGHTSPCLESELLTIPQARKQMVEHLAHRGFEADFLLAGDYQPSSYLNYGELSNPVSSMPCNDPTLGSKIEQGLCFYKVDQFQKALPLFQSAADENPQSELAFNNICATLINLGKYQKSIEACERATELRPDYELAQNNLAWAVDELTKARTRAREKEDMAINDNDAHAFSEAGHTFYGIGDYKDSLRCWEKALVLEPGNPTNMNNVAVAMIALKQYEQAIEMLEIAVSKDPNKPLYQNNIAWAISLRNKNN